MCRARFVPWRWQPATIVMTPSTGGRMSGSRMAGRIRLQIGSRGNGSAPPDARTLIPRGIEVNYAGERTQDLLRRGGAQGPQTIGRRDFRTAVRWTYPKRFRS